jgi:RNA-directed DNA polymerase
MSNLNITKLQFWNSIPWGNIELYVKSLQFQIYTCSLNQKGKKKLWLLQDELLKSSEAKLISIRRITQDNQGKITPGVDGKTFISPIERLNLAKSNIILDGKASPLRRIPIPKSDGTTRYLGIPTIEDRIRQYLLLLALEPEWEAKFDPNSFGFRPGYSTADAKFAVTRQIQGGPKWYLDVDIEKCFDKINHEYIIKQLNNKPFVKRQVEAWLKAGILTSHPEVSIVNTELHNQGTPQGGVISPLLANIALNGMEGAVCHGNKRNIRLIRYAYDVVVFSKDKKVITNALTSLKDFLSLIGLNLSESKTYVGYSMYSKYSKDRNGLDYLGFNFRNVETSIHKGVKNTRGVKQKFKQLSTPSRKSVQRHKANIKKALNRYKNAPLGAIMSRLVLIIKGWTYYYSICKATRIFSNLDAWMFKTLWNWSVKRYRSAKLAYKTCFSVRGWAFSTREKGKILILPRHDQTRIRNYVKVRKHASIYDSKLTLYWANRLSQHNARFRRMRGLLQKQEYKCTYCGNIFTSNDCIELHHTLNDKGLRTGEYNFIHSHCHDQVHSPK